MTKFDHNMACKYIEDAAGLGSRPGLDRIRGLCERLGHPEDKLRFIHVAGTNGKGSTSCMIAAALSETGLRVGMYYSPAISGITDHYMINGEPITESDFAASVSTVAAANEEMINDTGDGATQFELETAVAFTYFCEKNCDVVVMECGMGGRDDATNIVTNKLCCVITSVSYDHMQYLGDTLSKIASVKAGIITPGCPVITFDQGEEVLAAIRQRCDDTGSSLYTVDTSGIKSREVFPLGQIVSWEEFSDVVICLAGTFQAENAALAMRTLSVIYKLDLIPGCFIDEGVIGRGLKKARWPYRFECICSDPLMFVDGAHNADAAVKLLASIRQYLDGYKIVLIMGVFADKEYDKIVATLAKAAEMILTVQTPGNARALPAKDLAECAEKYCRSVRACDSIGNAYELALSAAEKMNGEGQRSAVVACGSLSYLHELTGIVMSHIP